MTICLVATTGCNHNLSSSRALHPTSITINNGQFVDNLGRQVILNGINMANKSQKDNYIFQAGPEVYQNLKTMGFNTIRLILIWDGLEPEPGKYDESYIEEIDKMIKRAEDNGLFVVLDMHQDLYSSKYSDGAPAWATLDEGAPHYTGDVWSDSYLISPAVQIAFDNFWANKPAPDGIGLQDHYAQAWKLLAERYKDNSTVIGFDLMNEPFPGSSAQEILPRLIEAYGSFVYKETGEILAPSELAEIWYNTDQRINAIKRLNTEEKYASVIDAIQPTVRDFERNNLQPFYQKVAHAIREVDQKHILFLEHSYFSNMGIKSTIERTLLSNGEPDPLVAYAPHGYDLVTDTDHVADASPHRINLIYKRVKEKGNELNMPIWLGEWGAYYGAQESVVPVAQYAIKQLETHLLSHAYWSYELGAESLAYFQNGLIRPYPTSVNGNILKYHYDFENKTFQMEWLESETSNAPTVIYTPDIKNLTADQLFETQIIEGTDAGWIIIPSTDVNKRSININFIN
ncbi:cellulase family glycosylhydrolase [Echinicola shivajiensis]|uniref:cellulase family glycosylhydrolase n=1 Tax=Echinicola shivajiensis TaxID=1035916 RepID=UPI001FE5E4AC|nr:cellulase family glycosylhydrolase [Echinicola shivajiensis]